VLVTGAGGFIGRSSIEPLRAAGYEVHGVLSLRGPSPLPEVCLTPANLHRADLLDHDAIDALIRKVRPTHLLHFAWVAIPGIYPTSPENYRWLAASQYLMRCFHSSGGIRAVMAGSCAEYDWSRAGTYNERTSPLADASGAAVRPYAECKIAMQRALEEFGCTRGLSSAWGRIFFQFGPHEYPERLVASVIVSLLRGREAACTHGRQIRSFLHVADVGAAFAAVLDSALEGAVNIGSDEGISVAELLTRVAGQIARPDLLKLDALSARQDEPPVLLPDVARLREELGFRPRMTLDEGLADTIDWWRVKLRETVAGSGASV
jgi:nucleoside-diphosphate-sugar epimerase